MTDRKTSPEIASLAAKQLRAPSLVLKLADIRSMAGSALSQSVPSSGARLAAQGLPTPSRHNRPDGLIARMAARGLSIRDD